MLVELDHEDALLPGLVQPPREGTAGVARPRPPRVVVEGLHAVVVAESGPGEVLPEELVAREGVGALVGLQETAVVAAAVEEQQLDRRRRALDALGQPAPRARLVRGHPAAGHPDVVASRPGDGPEVAVREEVHVGRPAHATGVLLAIGVVGRGAAVGIVVARGDEDRAGREGSELVDHEAQGVDVDGLVVEEIAGQKHAVEIAFAHQLHRPGEDLPPLVGARAHALGAQTESAAREGRAEVYVADLQEAQPTQGLDSSKRGPDARSIDEDAGGRIHDRRQCRASVSLLVTEEFAWWKRLGAAWSSSRAHPGRIARVCPGCCVPRRVGRRLVSTRHGTD